MIGQLVWKEWREHRWKMLGLATVIVAVEWAVQRQDDYVPSYVVTAVLVTAACILPVWIAAWTATAERSRNTSPLVSALPVRPWILFSIKSIFGLATVLVPLLAGGALRVTSVRFSFSAGYEYGPRALLETMVEALLVAAGLYFMFLALTINARREGAAAMVGLVVMVGSLLLFMVTALSYPRSWAAELCFMGLDPFFPFAREFPPGWEIPWIAYCSPTAVWGSVAAWRFCRQGRARRSWSERAAVGGVRRSADPRGFLVGALVWREWREQRWVIGGAGLGAVAISLIGTILTNDSWYYRGSSAGVVSLAVFTQFLKMMAVVIPTVAAIILGVASMAGDMGPRLMAFWRSRPVRIGAFFWTKYAVALTGICVLFGVLLSAAALGQHVVSLAASGSVRVDFPDMSQMLTGMAAWLMVVFAVTMFLSVLIRRTAYVVVLTTAALVGLYLGLEVWLTRVAATDQNELQNVVDMAGLGTAAILAVLAWVALERDWYIGRRMG